jgi:Mg2+-importing ATPase
MEQQWSWQAAALEEERAFGEDSSQGLTQAEAVMRLQRDGSNRIAGRRVYWWQTLLRQFRMPFVYLLIVAAVLSYILGERIEAVLILIFLAVNTGLGFFQEYRSSRAAELLKAFIIPMTRVKREGKVQMISSEELVVGDRVVFQAGDVFPADIRLLSTRALAVNESILTGESVLVEKQSATLPRAVSQLYQAQNIGFSGTSILRGQGEGVVIATGSRTALGEIASLAQTIDQPSAFEADISRFGSFLMRMVIVTLTLIFLAHLVIKGPNSHVGELLVFSLILMVSMIPEALPFFITTALSRGSLHLARKQVIVKRLSAIEELGSIEVLCTDKTGTLTENHSTVTECVLGPGVDQSMCSRAAFLAGGHTVVGEHDSERLDPFDIALWEYLPKQEQLACQEVTLLETLPFDPVRRLASALVHTESTVEIIVRGAPEAVLARCVNLSAQQTQTFLDRMVAAGHEGKRCLAIASRPWMRGKTYTVEDETTLHFLGLVFFTDPIKATAAAAIEEARRLGVRIVMLTGDSLEVATSVARQVGLLRQGAFVFTGDQWDGISAHERMHAVRQGVVFARISPRQKYEIIETLQRRFEVGFLGDGINDAPALELAHVALAVQGASDIARESADVVLLDSSLSVIMDGIREGRTIFANINKYLKTTLASNFGNFYSIALVSLLIPFVPMLPIQILLGDILSDMPMIAQAGDSVEHTELRRPRNYDVRGVVIIASLLGVVSSVFDFILFASFYQVSNPSILQTNWFILSLLTEIVLIYSVRTRGWFFQGLRPGRTLLAGTLVTLVLAFFLPYSSFGQRFFHFVPPTSGMLGWIILLVILYFITTEIVKHFYYVMKHQSSWGSRARV